MLELGSAAGADVARTSLTDSPFSQALEHGMRAEFGEGNLQAAEQHYLASIAAARNDFETGFGQLQLARTLMSAGRHEEARRIRLSLVALPGEVVDDHRIPLALYRR